jgi:hypothetical protein
VPFRSADFSERAGFNATPCDMACPSVSCPQFAGVVIIKVKAGHPANFALRAHAEVYL